MPPFPVKHVYIFYAEDLNSDACPGKPANVPVSLTLAI